MIIMQTQLGVYFLFPLYGTYLYSISGLMIAVGGKYKL